MTGLYSLSRKEGWRRWVDTQARQRPESLTARLLSRLGPAAREDYDEARHDWHANFGILKTPQLAAVHDELEQIVAANRQDPDRVRGAAVIDALPGLGKTTIVNVFARDFDRAQRRRLGEVTEEGHERLPVFRVGLTSRTTLRTLNRMICEFYGHPGTARASAAQLATFAVDCVLSCHTRVGIIDDLHFVDVNRRDGVEVSNHLKWLANELPVTFVYAGVGLAERRLFAEGLVGDSAVLAQTARRWTRLELPPFEVATDIGRRHWVSLLKATERQLVLAAAYPGMLTDLADYLFARSSGHIGSFITLVVRACWKAIRHGTERLSVELLDTIRIDEASEAARAALHAGFNSGTLSTRTRTRADACSRRRRRGMSSPDRRLPLRVGLGEGEALDSWLLRLAHRNQVPAQWLLPVLGLNRLPAPWRNHTLLRRLPAEVLRRIEVQTGLAPHALDRAVLDRFDPLGWQPTAGSRYCVTCLTDSDGVWPIRWRLPHVFACTRHRCLLAAVCPVCARAPLSSWSQQSGLAPPHRCAIRATHGDVCGADLLTHPVHRLEPDDPRLAAQVWINQRLDTLDLDAIVPAAMDPGACTDLRDLDAVGAWFTLRTEPDAVRHLGTASVDAVAEYRNPRQHNPLRRHRPTAVILAAVFAVRAVGLLTAEDDATRYQRFVPLFSDAQPRPASAAPPAPMILSYKRMARLSGPLQQRVLSACDPHLPISERLRYGTCTATPAMTDPGSGICGGRARHVPQYLWPDWIIRFQPTKGAYVDTLATDIPAALLLPGNHIRNRYATAELTAWTANTSQTLRLLGDHHRDALTAICALAHCLDTHGAPIDYRRRRATFTDVTLTRGQWHDLCYHVGADPGKGARQVHARRYLFSLLTGADLTNPQHRLAFRGANDKSEYLTRFRRWLATPLREALHRHAGDLLTNAGIDEPLTWSPPADCVNGLTLPGQDPDAIDPDTLHHLVTIDRVSLTAAARRLGVSIDHVRYALQQLPRPPAVLATSSHTAGRRQRERAATLLTRRFLQQQYVRGGKTLGTIEAETGVPRKLIAQHAHQLGIPLRGRRPEQPIDPGWLREQAETRSRTNGDIAADLGVTHETIRRHRKNLGITAGRTGVHRQQLQRHPHLPGDIRRAVESTRHGWQRLRRFQQVTAYPSINAAATALGLFQQNLFLQLARLEADIGAALINRTNHRYQPMTLTERGRQLFQQLDQHDIRELLDRYAKPRHSRKRNE